MRIFTLILCLSFLVSPFNVSAATYPEIILVPLSVQNIVAEVNKERVAHSLPVLKQHVSLTKAAELKVKDIASRGVLSHTKSVSGALWWPVESAHYSYEAVGENLAEGIDDAKELVAEWMASPEHRANILNPLYSDIGVAIEQGVYQGEIVSFVVEYTAKPKVVAPKAVLGASTTQANQAELIRQLIGLLMQYLAVLQTQS